MRQISYIVLSCLMMGITACKKETVSEQPPISPVPSIELRNTAPTVVTEYEDSIVFDLFYQDGDGDLGFADPDSTSVFLVDTRIQTVEDFYLPLLAPENVSVPIQGIFQLHLDRTILTGSGDTPETVVFQIYLRDRAGHQSNVVSTPAITVNPQ